MMQLRAFVTCIFVFVACINGQVVEGDPSLAAPRSTTMPATTLTIGSTSRPASVESAGHLLPDVRLTPRTVAIDELVNSKLDLDGAWDFVRDIPAGLHPARDSERLDWRKVHVPGHFALQGFGRMHNADGVPVAYRRQIEVPADWADRAAILRFERVDGRTHVWVNGVAVGERDIASLPIEFDVASYLRPGHINEIVLTVEKSLVTRWSRRELGGLIASVYLQALPTIHLSRAHVETQLNHEGRSARVIAHLRVVNQSNQTSRALSVRLFVSGPGKQREMILESPVLPALEAGATLELPLTASLSEPAFWSAETPDLYTLEVELLDAGARLMTASQRFGVREVKIAGHKILLNGTPIRLLGTNYHISVPATGETVLREAINKDIELFQAANLNALRPRPVPSEAYADLCDELGMYTTVEAMISLMMYDAGVEKDHGKNDAMAVPYRFHVATMIESLYSHPSILTWGLGNECPYYEYFKVGAIGMGERDPSRPLFFGSDARLGVGIPFMDINDDHYPRDGVTTVGDPGAIRGEGSDYPKDRPNIFTEWMHVHTNNVKEIDYHPGIDDFWGYVAAAHIEFMYRTPEYAGGFLFKGAPYRGVGIKFPWRGLFDEDRNLNDLHWHTQKAHSPIRLDDLNPRSAADAKGVSLDVINRYDFTNMGDVEFRWRQRDRAGTTRVAIAPGATGTLEVPCELHLPLELEAFDARGKSVDRWVIPPLRTPSAASAPVTTSTATRPSSPLVVEQDNATLRIRRDADVFTFDNKTGLLVGVSLDGNPCVVGSPTLSVLPAQFLKFENQKKATLVNQCSNWVLTSQDVARSPGRIVVTSSGQYDNASGSFIYDISADGELTIAYDFEWTSATVTFNCFNWGLAVPVHESYDTLEWTRNAQWTVYPETHIGRPTGRVSARLPATLPATTARWSAASIDGVSRDFRSTKFHLTLGGLQDIDRRFIGVISDGTQHLHVVPNNGTLGGKLSVADLHGLPRPGFLMHALRFHGGGTEPHLTKSMVFQTLNVAPGVQFKDRVVLRLGVTPEAE